MKVKATDKFEKLNVRPEELTEIPKKGKEFEVTKERFEILTKTNKYNLKFVEPIETVKKTTRIETAKKENKTEKAVKKTMKKSK